MAFTIPDKGEGDNDIQSILFQEYLEIFLEGIQGNNCVLSGLAMTGGADMTPDVAKGAVLTNGIIKAVAAATVTIGTADATNPRIDLVVVNSSGSLAVRAGTAAAAPKPPARTADDVVIAAIYVAENDTSIGSGSIVDMRMIRQDPICIYRTTTQEVTNTTASEVHLLDKTNSGVTLPSGLFTAGRKARVRIGGTWKNNSGATPTIRLRVYYGGTVMFNDIGNITTSDADQGALWIEFDLTATSTTAQAVNGFINPDQWGAKTAPTTGTAGDVSSSTAFVTPIRGTAAVDSDAGNRVIAVTGQWSASSANNEFTIDTATVELI